VPIARFATELLQHLERNPVPQDVSSESELERRFVIPVACRLAASHADVLVYTHPFRSRRLCAPACVHVPPAGSGRIIGCPKCWTASKAWASPAAFGTHHSFDLVARDGSKTLALELKLSRARGGRMPNGDVQRFLGQCALAATKHSEVIGFFAHRGAFDARWHRDTNAVGKWFKAGNVRLLFRPI